MTGESCAIHQHGMVADDRIVAHVGICHDQRVAPDGGHAAAFDRAPIDGRVFANHIVAAHFQPRLFSFVAQVLGFAADGAEREEPVVPADLRRAVNHHMRNQLALLSQFHVRAQDAVWPHRAGGMHVCLGINDCCGMDHSVVSAGGPEAARPRFIDTSCALTVPSQTSLPFTNALPSMRTAIREAPSFQLSITTSIRSWSPGTTGRRKRAFSIPVKTISLLLRSSTSVSSIAPPAWAMASTISTPGMMGYPGKWPAKNGSLMVTFLMATIFFLRSISSTRSIKRKG